MLVYALQAVGGAFVAELLTDEQELRQIVDRLLSTQRFAVLCTHQRGAPYGSLVCFASSDDGRCLVFATPRATRKYANIDADPRSALVVDSTTNAESDIYKATAATAVGKVAELTGDEREAYARIYLSKFPHLDSFLKSPNCALLTLAVESYHVVTRFQEVVELRVVS